MIFCQKIQKWRAPQLKGRCPIGPKLWIFQFRPKTSHFIHFEVNRRGSLRLPDHLTWDDRYLILLSASIDQIHKEEQMPWQMY